MPIATFHISEKLLNSERAEQILTRASTIYAEELDSPVARVRTLINPYPGPYAAVGGQLCSTSGEGAVFFDYIVLDGRPAEQRWRVAERFTSLLSDVLNVDRSLIRGRCSPVKPDDWFIAGRPASEIRKAEVEARKRAEEANHG